MIEVEKKVLEFTLQWQLSCLQTFFHTYDKNGNNDFPHCARGNPTTQHCTKLHSPQNRLPTIFHHESAKKHDPNIHRHLPAQKYEIYERKISLRKFPNPTAPKGPQFPRRNTTRSGGFRQKSHGTNWKTEPSRGPRDKIPRLIPFGPTKIVRQARRIQ